jgi:predicted esterase
MIRSALLASLVVFAASPIPAFGQPGHYDLGQKLRSFELAWDQVTDVAARRRAIPVLKSVVPLLFAGQNAEAGRAFDQSQFLLRSAEQPSAGQRWATSLVIRPSARLFDPADGPLSIEVVAYYDAQVPRPEHAKLRWRICRAGGESGADREEPLTSLPARSSQAVADLKEGDHLIRAEIVVDGKVLARHEHIISAVPRLQDRLRALRAAAVGTASTTARLTLKSLSTRLSGLAGGEDYETGVPAARLLLEAEALARGSEHYYGPKRPGQFWLSLPAGQGAAAVRLFVPKGLSANKPVPLVVALHGAGCTENYFFDGYGRGATVRFCKERGWLMVATRAGGFGQAPPVADVVDELARLYPVDRKRVYLVGHSMGATHAVEVAQTSPGRLAAIAALGGGGIVRRPEVLRGLPVFVGVGSEDFALGWARGLAKSLSDAGAAVTSKEYADVEHVMVVQEALKEVFAFFEKCR